MRLQPSRRRPSIPFICAALCSLVVASLVAGPAGAGEERGATLILGEPQVATTDVRDQVTTQPPLRPATPAGAIAAPLPLEGYTLLDSLRAGRFVLAGGEYAVRFDAANLSVEEALVSFDLTPTAWNAIAVAPVWMRRDLEWNLHYLSSENQDRYGNLLLGVTDPRIVDEVAFQIAHLSYTTLQLATWDANLLVVNAQLMYQIDPELQYVDIVEHDLGDGDFYSTTVYRTVANGDTLSVEIPKEMYYWYIVMPKVSDERPLMGGGVYNYFWREYLFYHHDSGYPLMQEVMQPVECLWDGEQHDWSGGRAFTDDMLAVDAVGNWCSETVPAAASGNRPIQPNIIAHEHDGNCGELQDLLCAAARTCLIPAVCTMDILEDHVWCEMWFGEWRPYQIDLGRGPTHINNPGIAYDVDRGGSKEVSCVWDWRNDGFVWDAVATYSQVCTLTVAVNDLQGMPVDNAFVTIASEYYYSPYTLYDGTWGETTADGTIRFILGNNQNYYVRVQTQLGNFPGSGYAQILSNTVAGEHYSWSWTAPQALTQLQVTSLPSGIDAPYVIEVEYDLPFDMQFGYDHWASPADYYAQHLAPGHLAFFIVDEENLQNYLNRQPFAAYEAVDGLPSNHLFFQVPDLRDYYLVLSGAEHHGFATLADCAVRVWERNSGGIGSSTDAALRLSVSPSPWTGSATIRYVLPGASAMGVDLSIFDAGGRLVRSLVRDAQRGGAYTLRWDGTDAAGRSLEPGVYFYRLAAGQDVVTRRIVRLGR